ncbi:MCE family protein [Mycobacterium sp. 050134]|uniref:MCE family protein n=1 Tax=Mycobacterium sp. 050134 TaxID=3096111 RepID=UPI002ED965DA
MKSFQERNPVVIGAIGLVVVALIPLVAWYYDELPFVSSGRSYSAYFTEAGGLTSGAEVQVSGLKVGSVSSVSLDGPRVLVKFKIDGDVRLGDRTEAAVKTKSLLGTKILGVTPRGGGQLSGPIPLDRTRPAYQLPDALGDITAAISGLNTDQLSNSLSVLAQTFQDTPPDVEVAVQGVAQFSKALDRRDAELRNLLSNANKATSVLAQRSDEVVRLVADTNSLLKQLRAQSAALNHIATNISRVSRQLSGLVDDNRQQLKPALDRLNGALALVDNHKEKVQEWIKKFGSYVLSLGESVSSGPFFKAYVVNLLPGQFLQPFIDSAFSDLGLDPNTLLPSQRTDPQVGQPATPPLPVPYPRTGQGGAPRQTLPDAITGKPEDHVCGPPGLPLPGPGCYPQREPQPAPPPGGPPPGPPEHMPGDDHSVVAPKPTPIFVPAPGEVSTPGSAASQRGSGQ